MKRVFLIFIFFSSGFVFSQEKYELITGFSVSSGMKNRFVGTSSNYESYSEFSGVNLKCSSNNFGYLGIRRFISKYNFYGEFGFQKRWLVYKTQLYPQNYNGSADIPFSDLTMTNQMNNFNMGFGKRFVLMKNKLSMDVGIEANYRNYRDEFIELRTNRNPNLEKIDSFDYDYIVRLDFSSYNHKIAGSANVNLNYQLTNKMAVYLNLNLVQQFRTYYEFNFTNYIKNPDPNSSTLFWSTTSDMADFVIQSKFFNFGIGCNFKL